MISRFEGRDTLRLCKEILGGVTVCWEQCTDTSLRKLSDLVSDAEQGILPDDLWRYPSWTQAHLRAVAHHALCRLHR